MDKFLHSLDIYIDGDMKGDEYVADIMDSDEYDRILSKLSNNTDVLAVLVESHVLDSSLKSSLFFISVILLAMCLVS